MNYAKWNKHVQDCLYARLYDTERYDLAEEILDAIRSTNQDYA